MRYYFTKIVKTSFDEAVEKVTAELKVEGFGILTEIDVRETLKKKIECGFFDGTKSWEPATPRLRTRH